MKRYFQNTSNTKEKCKESDDIKPPRTSSTHKKTSNKKYKKEQNDLNPKWPQTYSQLVRREDKEGKPFMYCIWCEEGKMNNIFTKVVTNSKKIIMIIM